MNNVLWEDARCDLFLSLAWFSKTQVILINQCPHLFILKGTVVI